MEIKRSGHGRVYIDEAGQVQYEYQEPAPMPPKMLDFIMGRFYDAHPHLKKPKQEEQKRNSP